MKTQHQKLKNPPRPLFSCGIFHYCTEPVLSPTNPPPSTPIFPPPISSHPPPPPPPLRPINPSPQPESESSSSSTSQSFTQWRFPLPDSPMSLNQQSVSQFTHHPTSETPPQTNNPPPSPPPPPQLTVPYTNQAELFHVAELQFSSSNDSHATRLSTLYLLERSLVPNPPTDGGKDPACPPAVMCEVVKFLRDNEGAKPATKVLLALCLSEGNRHVAVETGAVVEVVEVLPELEGAAAERALAALELLCTVAEGVAELRAHALAVPMLIQVVERMMGRGKECAISVLAAIFSGGGVGGGEAVDLPEELARAIVMGLQGECSARGRRKGIQLLKSLQESGRLDFIEEGLPLIMNYGP